MVKHDDAWDRQFEEPSGRLMAVMAGELVRDIDHIGSTAIAGLCARPIIDMLAVVADIDAVDDLDGSVRALSWLLAPEPGDTAQRRRSYCFSTLEHRTHHLHVVEVDHPRWRGWLVFRDRLKHPFLAAGSAAPLCLRTGAPSLG